MVSCWLFNDSYRYQSPETSLCGSYTLQRRANGTSNPRSSEYRQFAWPTLLLTLTSIVAVHGINPSSKPDEQHAWDTWRKPAGPTGRLWLRDGLPKFAPRSRIFLYEYNSSLVYGGDKGRFIDKANDLLEALRADRKKVLTLRSLPR